MERGTLSEDQAVSGSKREKELGWEEQESRSGESLSDEAAVGDRDDERESYERWVERRMRREHRL